MTAATIRHPDIEIYLAGINARRAQEWLETVLGKPSTSAARGIQTQLRFDTQHHTIPVLVVEKAAGRYTSLWFDSPATPWATDLECAREARQFFQCEVRCIHSGWQEGDDPDEWWSLTAEGERLIQWRSA